MNVSFDALERKLDQLIALSARLHTENRTLRAQVAALETDNAALHDRIDAARTRMVTLMQRLPAE